MTLYNLVKVTTATTGTGTVVLGNAVSGYLSFLSASVVDGATISYGIQEGTNSEVGRGVYTASASSLTRGTILNSTNEGNAIVLGGAATVFITALAQDFNISGSTIMSDTTGSSVKHNISGITAGSYNRVEVDKWGHAISGSIITTVDVLQVQVFS